MKIVIIPKESRDKGIYSIATNFRGLKFSRISLEQTLCDLIFEGSITARVHVYAQLKVSRIKVFVVHG